jgi:hypothetical protein
LAFSVHPDAAFECPLSGGDRTLRFVAVISAFDL